MLKSKVAKRIFFGSIMIAFLTSLMVVDGYISSSNSCSGCSNKGIITAVFMVLIGSLGSLELLAFARNKKLSPPAITTIIAVGAIIMHPFWSEYLIQKSITLTSLFAVILSVGFFAGAFVQGRKIGTDNTIGNLASSCMIMIYMGLGLYFMLAIRLLGSENKTIWGQMGLFIMFLATVKSADIGAYFTGRAIGRHKWVPGISPNKTWEGFIGGIGLSVIVASIFAFTSAIISPGIAVVFGIVMAVTGQLGDLLESMLKRDANIKDSASLVPEFGGILDMIDSPVVAAPFAILIYSFCI